MLPTGGFMQFEHEIHEQTYVKVRDHLLDLFEDPMLEEDSGHAYVQYGSTVLEIAVESYGPEEAMVVVMAHCVQGVELAEGLLLGLLELNHSLPFGAFSLAGDDVYFSHTLFGRSLDRTNLLGAIAAVANVADEYDDRIVARYGGQTALDRIREFGGARASRRGAVVATPET
jgi:hypothetical protein